MTDKILCPWCGSEMVVEARWHWNDADDRERAWNAWTKCSNEDCGSDGPYALDRPTEEEAINDALKRCLHRYKPQIRPMTWEEVTKHDGSTLVWVEDRLMAGNSGFYDTDEWVGVFGSRYGKTWRCWPRKPTEQERKEAKWDD